MKKITSILAFLASVLLAVLVIIIGLKGTSLFVKISPASVAVPRVVPTELPRFTRPSLQRGMAAAVWTNDGYNQNNLSYQNALGDIYAQTGATWISMQVSFTQDSDSSTTIKGGNPTLESFTEGVRSAREAGYHIFFEPLITVTGGSDRWGGKIQPQNIQQESVWLQNWYNALLPYIKAAQQAGVEQIAIGTELEWLQYHAPNSLWNHFISQVHAIFKGKIIYDTNWDFKQNGLPLPGWFHNPELGALGVSEYIPLINTRSFIPASQATGLWNIKIRKPIDSLSREINKPIVLSEFGYRDTIDAGFNPYEYVSLLKQNLQEQSILFNAAFSNIMEDTHIIGVFIWCWSNGNRFSLTGHPALAVIHSWYVR